LYGTEVNIPTKLTTNNIDDTASGVANLFSSKTSNNINCLGSTGSATLDVRSGGLRSNTIGGIATTGTQNLFNTKSAGDLDMFTTGGTANLHVQGTGGVKTNNLIGGSATSTMSIGKNITTGPVGNIGIKIGENLTSGKIEMGMVQTNGAINIGAGASRTGDINIGTQQTGGAIAIGTITNTQTTINGGVIKQVTPLATGGVCEVVVGNADNISSMSTTFNRKSLVGVGPIPCYTIVAPTNYSCQYFELIISGSNGNRGGYSYKGCFVIDLPSSGLIVTSSVNTLYYFGEIASSGLPGTPPVITFTVVGTTITLNVDTSAGSVNQTFITTLISYPSITISGILDDYSITAIP
jgi:hypothetical protein